MRLRRSLTPKTVAQNTKSVNQGNSYTKKAAAVARKTGRTMAEGMPKTRGQL